LFFAGLILGRGFGSKTVLRRALELALEFELALAFEPAA
jgi:hypothetical protein